MKTVWILNHYAQEPGRPGGTRHHALACHLPQFDWRAYILASSVELNTGRQRLTGNEKTLFMPLENLPGGFLWIRTPTYTGNGIGRVLNMLSYTTRALLSHTTQGLPKPDIIIGSSVHPFAALAGLRLARKYRVPFIFEVRDLWPQTLIDMGRLKSGHPTTMALQGLERYLYHHSDKIIVLLPYAKEYIAPLGIPCSRIYWIPNGTDLEQFPAISAPMREPFTLMYFGAHGAANGLRNIIEAMVLIERRYPALPIKLRLVGDGPLKADLIQQAHVLGLHNVSFENPVPKYQIPSLAAEADAFVFNLINAPVFKYGISSNKLFDFMSAKRPVLFCCDAQNNPVAESGCGITVRPEDPQALCDAIIQLYEMPIDTRQSMGALGRRYIEENHDIRQLAIKLMDVLDGLTNQSQRRGHEAGV